MELLGRIQTFTKSLLQPEPVLSTLGPFGLLICDIPLNITTQQNVPYQYRTIFAGSYRYGFISPKVSLTGEDPLHLPNTPSEATWVVWAYQVLGIEQFSTQTVANTPEEKFILFGGFIFLDDFDTVVGVFSVDDYGTDIFFEGPFIFQDVGKIKKIEDSDRFQPVTIQNLLNKQIEKYCWILPGETQSDGKVISKYGAFLYFHKTTNTYFYFCLVNSPKIDNEKDIVIWEWLDKYEYRAFDTYTHQLLYRAFDTYTNQLEMKKDPPPSPSLTLKHSHFQNGPYVVDFHKMTQTNTKTQFVRKLRRLKCTTTRSCARWECKVEKKWVSYSREITANLEKEFCSALSSGPPKITFTQSQGPKTVPYELDFCTMTQTNKQTGHPRPVRRQVDARWNFVNSDVPKVGPRIIEKKNIGSLSITGFGVVPEEKCQPCYGIVEINIDSATNIFCKSMGGTDPFIVITTDFSSFTWRTTWKSSTNNPIWKETCCFQICRDNQEGNIFFTFYDHQHFRKDMYLGRLDVSLFEIIQKLVIRDNRKLDYQSVPVTDLHPAAEFTFTITYTPEAPQVKPPINLGTILDNIAPDLEKKAEAAKIIRPPPPNKGESPTTNEWATRTYTKLLSAKSSPTGGGRTGVTMSTPTGVGRTGVNMSTSTVGTGTPLSPSTRGWGRTGAPMPPPTREEEWTDGPMSPPTGGERTGVLISPPTGEERTAIYHTSPISPMSISMKNGARRIPTSLIKREIVQFTNPDVVEGRFGKYNLQEEIGNGGYAVVRKAEIPETNELVAVKIIQKKGNVDEDKIRKIIQEIQIMHLMANDCCISLVDSRETNDFIYIIMLFCCGDLFEAVHYDNFTESKVKRAIVHVIYGLQYLHTIGICHRDIKPGNILYHYDTDQWKIADFGISAIFTEDNPKITGSIGTLHYMAPEMLTQPEYTKAVDLWATGVTCYYALSKKYPFDGEVDDLVKQEIIDGRLSFANDFPELNSELKDFINRLLIKEEEDRMTIEQAIYHTWITY